MKDLSMTVIVLFCVLFVNITNAQTVKKLLTNKERLTKSTRTVQNTKSADFSTDEQSDITSPKKNSKKPKQLNRKSAKIKMISPTSVVPQITKKEDMQLDGEKENTAKKQSNRPKYHQQRKIIGQTENVKDE